MDPIADVASKLEAKVASFVKEHRLPGAAAGIVHGDSLAWFDGEGSLTSPRVAPPKSRRSIASPRSRRPSRAPRSCSCATRACSIWMTRR